MGAGALVCIVVPPVHRRGIHLLLGNCNYAKRVGAFAFVYTAPVMEILYLAVEVLVLVVNVARRARDNKNTRIVPPHLHVGKHEQRYMGMLVWIQL